MKEKKHRKKKGEYIYEFRTRVVDIDAGKFIVLMNKKDMRRLGLNALDRVRVRSPRNGLGLVAIVDETKTFVRGGEIGLYIDTARKLGIKKREKIKVSLERIPGSIQHIKEKMDGKSLSEKQIFDIVKDIKENRISEGELSSFMTSVYIHGFDIEETKAMTKALIRSGRKIFFRGKKPVLDKHSIGGSNGRVSMLVVPIVAANGFLIPKTSSRSITSAAGTADAMEVLANVNLSFEKIKKVIRKTNGVITWGGALELAPVDDIIIKVERPLGIDPFGQIVASVLAKKASVGSKKVVIDIPIGNEVKVKTKNDGKRLAERFVKVGKELGIEVRAILTDGSKPTSRFFGAGLEAKEVLEVLEGKIFNNMAKKACILAGKLLEMTKKIKKGEGYRIAKKTLENGKALEKMKEIIKAQGKKLDKSNKIKLGRFTYELKARKDGFINNFGIKRLIYLARQLGSPEDKGAGIALSFIGNARVKKGDTIMRLYSNNREKLGIVKDLTIKNPGIYGEKIFLEEIS